MGAIIIQGGSICAPAIKTTACTPGAAPRGSGLDECPAGVDIQQKNHLGVGSSGGEAEIRVARRAAAWSKANPIACFHHPAVVGVSVGNHVGQPVKAVSQVSHQGFRVIVDPTLEISHDCVGSGQNIPVDIDDVLGRQIGRAGIRSVVVGIKSDQHVLPGGRGAEPGIVGGIDRTPIPAGHHLKLVVTSRQNGLA